MNCREDDESENRERGNDTISLNYSCKTYTCKLFMKTYTAHTCNYIVFCAAAGVEMGDDSSCIFCWEIFNGILKAF